MKRVLKPNGKLVVVTDNAGYFGYHLGKHGHSGYVFHNIDGFTDQHYSLFSLGHLRNHLEFMGLKIVQMRYLDFGSAPALVARIIQKPLRRIPRLKSIAYPRVTIVALKIATDLSGEKKLD